MAQPIAIPDLGTNVDQVTLIKWCKKEGEHVRQGEVLCEIETDKAASEMESYAEGTLLCRLVQEGDEIDAGTVIAYVGKPGEVVPDAPKPAVSRTVAPPRRAAIAPAAPPAPQAPARQPKARLVMTKDGALRDKDAVPTGQPAYRREFLLDLYRRMLRIRTFEERVKLLFLQGIMPGTIHQYQGQEACAVGVCAALETGDVITSTHRPHGHAIARGLSCAEIMAELFGRTTGCCRGKGGSMHVGDLAKGMLPAIAIVGGGVPIATGMALAFKMRRERRVAVCFTGDGGANEGAFHEGVNMGAIWDLPVVYVIENNLYGASTHVSRVFKTRTIAERAAGYGIPGVTIDGNDVLEVYRAALEAVGRARGGAGPTILELMTYRITGHSRRDPALYQPKEEKQAALEREPIGRFAKRLLAEGTATPECLARIAAEVTAEIEAAVESAQSAPEPRPEDALAGLFEE